MYRYYKPVQGLAFPGNSFLPALYSRRTCLVRRVLVVIAGAVILLIVARAFSQIALGAKCIDRDQLRAEVLNALAGHNGVFGVYVKVLETGEEFRLNDGEYISASCYKLPLVLLLYEMASAGELSLDYTIVVRAEDWEEGTGVLQLGKPGMELKIRKLAELAITESDNVAANALLRCIGRDRLRSYYHAVGARIIPLERNVSSPSDMGRFAERLISFAQKNPGLGKELLSYFLENRFKDRLAANLPKGVQVANKIGTWPGTVNDVGIVVLERISYVIAVMSRDVGPTTEIGKRAVADVSAAVFKHISRRSSKSPLATSVARNALGSIR